MPRRIIRQCVGCILPPASPAHITHLGPRVPDSRAMTWTCGVNWLGRAAGGFAKVLLVSLCHTSSPCYMTHELINLHLNTSAAFSTELNDIIAANALTLDTQAAIACQAGNFRPGKHRCGCREKVHVNNLGGWCTQYLLKVVFFAATFGLSPCKKQANKKVFVKKHLQGFHTSLGRFKLMT